MFRHIMRFLIAIIRLLARALLAFGWYLAFYILCMFRPVTNMMLLAAIVMFPIAIVTFVHPDAARGMPFWGFGLMGIGVIGFSIAYRLFVDCITPPGAVDPFARYRRSDR